MHRRGLLVATGGLLAGAGCTIGTNDQPSPSSSPVPTATDASPTDARTEANDALGLFYLNNGAETPVSFELVVNRLDDNETVLDDTVPLAAGGSKRFNEVISTMGTYRFRIETDTGGETTYTWRIPTCRDYDYLNIAFSEGDIEVIETYQTIVPPPTCARDLHRPDL